MLSFLLSHVSKYKKSLTVLSLLASSLIGTIWSYDLRQLTLSGTLDHQELFRIRIFLTLLSISLYLLSLFIITLIHYKKDIEPITITPEERARYLKILGLNAQPSTSNSGTTSSASNPQPGTSSVPKYKIALFEVGDYKWKTKIYRPDYFEVDRYPICIKHDLPLIYDDKMYKCPESEEGNCYNKFASYNHEKLYDTAKSYIEKEIRNNPSLAPEPLKPVSASSPPAPSRRRSWVMDWRR